MKKSHSAFDLSDKTCLTTGCKKKIKKRLESKNNYCYSCYTKAKNFTNKLVKLELK